MSKTSRTVRHQFRAYPTEDQVIYLVQHFGAARAVFNHYIWNKEQAYQASLNGTTHEWFPLDKASERPESFSWMKDHSQVILQQATRQAQTAYRNFFQSAKGQRKGSRVAKPRFKKKNLGYQTVTWTGSNNLAVTQFNKKWSGVRLPKNGTWLRFRLTRKLPRPSSVTVIKRPDGKYMVSFVVTEPVAPRKTKGTTIGVDPGLTRTVTWVKDDGTKGWASALRSLRLSEARLANIQRRQAKKVKGSNNYLRMKVQIARLHQKIKDQRDDYLKKLSATMADENQAVMLEDLQVKGLTKNRSLSKSFADTGLGSLKGYLDNACEKRGTGFHLVPPAGTTRVCSLCGTNGGSKPLDVRVWTCGTCGEVLDRDYNAATNILMGGIQPTGAGHALVKLDLDRIRSLAGPDTV